jgi:hypothetical protein
MWREILKSFWFSGSTPGFDTKNYSGNCDIPSWRPVCLWAASRRPGAARPARVATVNSTRPAEVPCCLELCSVRPSSIGATGPWRWSASTSRCYQKLKSRRDGRASQTPVWASASRIRVSPSGRARRWRVAGHRAIPPSGHSFLFVPCDPLIPLPACALFKMCMHFLY